MTTLRPPHRARLSDGFTLIELMAVCLIIGLALLLVPSNFSTFGSRSRLSSAANTLLAQMVATREQSTMDGYEARLELGTIPGEGKQKRTGVRIWYTNVPAKGAQLQSKDEDVSRERATSRAEDRQWLTSGWKELPDGIRVSGVSLSAGQWEKLSEGSTTFQVRYLPDGSVDRGFAIRLEAEDLDVKTEFRTLTIVVNPLTAEAASYEGFRELSKQRDPHEFR